MSGVVLTLPFLSSFQGSRRGFRPPPMSPSFYCPPRFHLLLIGPLYHVHILNLHQDTSNAFAPTLQYQTRGRRYYLLQNTPLDASLETTVVVRL